jgi:uncharacterized protein YjiS (DUF1127 family)
MFIKAIEVERQTRIANSRPSILKVISIWMERRTQRQALADLDQHLLSDIGISDAARAGEIAKPFWRQ